MLGMDRATVEAAVEKYGKRVGEVIGVSKKFAPSTSAPMIFLAR